MGLAELFYAKHTSRESVWRFLRRSTSRFSRMTQHSASARPSPLSLTLHPSRFLLEFLEPRLLLSATPEPLALTSEATLELAAIMEAARAFCQAAPQRPV